MTEIILTICFLGILLGVILLIRNHFVYEYRKELLNKISERNGYSADWEWRYDEFEKISYNEMVFKFWKPLTSFYDEDKILK